MTTSRAEEQLPQDLFDRWFDSGANTGKQQRGFKTEFLAACYRVQDSDYSRGNSIAGRFVCALLIPIHILEIALKPVFYLSLATITGVKTIYLIACKTISIAITCFKSLAVKAGLRAPFEKKQKNYHIFIQIKGGVGLTLAAIAAPFGQIILTCKATAGIIHPGAYFKS